MKIPALYILLILFFQSHAQSFEALIEQAESLYNNKQYAESANKYGDAFKLHKGAALDYYNAACSWALTGDTVQSVIYLKQAAEAGWRNLKHLKADKDLGGLHTVEGWDEIVMIVQKNLDEYEKNFNKPLKNQLEQIYVRDQTLRQLYQEAEENFGRDSDEMKYFWKLMHEQDSLNEREVIGIIEKYGWVGTSEVGDQANMTLWLVIQHASVEIQEKYVPLLRESVKKGESSGNHLALLEDRILMYNNKPQIYGSQIGFDDKTGSYYVYTIQDPEYVNQRRKEVGLGTIEEYVKRWGIEWTVPQKEKAEQVEKKEKKVKR